MARRSYDDEDYCYEGDDLDTIHPRAAVVQLKRFATAGDDTHFLHVLGQLWDALAAAEGQGRPWADLQRVPIGCCPDAVTGDELAAFCGLLAAAWVEFTPPPPKPRSRKRSD